jgi:hypothetical protein
VQLLDQDILNTFKKLKYPAVFCKEAPEGRFACFIFLLDDGFVWLEPGYQEPWDKWPRVKSIESNLTLKSGCIVFEDGWIGEGNPEDGEVIWHYWLDYLRQFGRTWEQERDYVINDCLQGQWQGKSIR